MILSASGPWYTSATTASALSVALVVLGILTVGITYYFGRAGAPRKRIIYKIDTVISLLTLTNPLMTRSFNVDAIKVTYDHGDERGAVPVSEPYLVTLNVESKSRRDISSKEFDANKPLVFDLGTQIVARVGEPDSDETASSYNDVLTITERTVEIGPYLIRKGSIISLDLLLSGRPRVTHMSPLIDVDVQQGDDDDVFGWAKGAAVFTAFALIAAFTMGLTVLESVVNQHLYKSIYNSYARSESFFHSTLHVEIITVIIFFPILTVAIIVGVLLSRRRPRNARKWW